MNSETDRITNELESLHKMNVIAAKQRDYGAININLEKIKIIESQLNRVNKINELTNLMNFLNKEIPIVACPSFEDNMHRAYNGLSTCPITLSAVDRKVFKAMFEAIVELNNKVEALK